MPRIALLSLIVLPLAAAAVLAQDRDYPPKLEGAREEIYKKAGDVELKLYIFEPEGHKASDKRPAIVFFFGGGWKNGSPAQFREQCRYLASRGMLAVTADYRVSSRHQTKARECVADGKSAVRYLRANAERLGIDPERIAAGGGSAGGHVAACTGVIGEFDESDEDATVSSRPDAMVLFNPAVALDSVEGREPFAEERLEELQGRMGVEPQRLSPVHHVTKGAPPTIIFHGEADSTVPYWTVEEFAERMKKAGNRCELVGYEGQPHGFFNYGRKNGKYVETVREMDKFLASLGWLEGEPAVAGETQ